MRESPVATSAFFFSIYACKMQGMSEKLSKKDMKHLAELARLQLDPKEEEKLLKDLQNILTHFESLKALDTSNVAPLTGGTTLQNVFREDSSRENTNQSKGTENFPESQKGFLKVPPVFEK